MDTKHEQILDFRALEQFLTNACEQYQASAPTVCEYCDDLYVRIHEHPEAVRLIEIMKITALLENGE